MGGLALACVDAFVMEGSIMPMALLFTPSLKFLRLEEYNGNHLARWRCTERQQQTLAWGRRQDILETMRTFLAGAFDFARTEREAGVQTDRAPPSPPRAQCARLGHVKK